MQFFSKAKTVLIGTEQDPSPYTLWYLALSQGIFFLLKLFTLSPVALGLASISLSIAYIFVFFLDWKAFHVARPSAKKISRWWILLLPVYLFKRCRRTPCPQTPFWAHLALGLSILVFGAVSVNNQQKRLLADFAQGHTTRLPLNYPKSYVPVFPTDANAQKRLAPLLIQKFPSDPRLRYTLASIAYDADNFDEAERQLGAIKDDTASAHYFPDVSIEAEALWARIRADKGDDVGARQHAAAVCNSKLAAARAFIADLDICGDKSSIGNR